MNRISLLTTVILFGSTLSAVAQTNTPILPESPPKRIAFVNISAVLRDYDKANATGEEIAGLRAIYIGPVTVLRNKMAKAKADYDKTNDPVTRQKLEADVAVIQRQIQDIDGEAQEALTKKSNETIIRVYKEIQGAITDIAKANDLGLVLCYPGPSKVADETNPAVAQLMLQTPALIPFYFDNRLDITHVVLETINKRYPPPTSYKPTPMKMAPVPGM